MIIVEINGISKSLSAWSKSVGISKSTICQRYTSGYRGMDLLRQPRKIKKYHGEKKAKYFKHEEVPELYILTQTEAKSKPTKNSIIETKRLLKDFQITVAVIPTFDSLYKLIAWRKALIENYLNLA